MKNNILCLFIAMVCIGCAQVPPESVQLSRTVGEDIARAQAAHIATARLLFTRMKEDINRFIDEDYAPYLIREAMLKQKQLADSTNASDRRKSILTGIHVAFSPGASAALQDNVLKAMQIFVARIRDRVEAMRKELLQPIKQQERDVIKSIDRSYMDMRYANSIVTGHLSSVSKVHEAQADWLQQFGVKRDLRSEIGDSLSDASDRIAEITRKGENAQERIGQAEIKAGELKRVIEQLKEKLSGKKDQ